MPRKPPGKAVDPRNGQRAQVSRTKLERFDPPSNVSEESKSLWNAFWDDSVSSVLTIADKGMLSRWIELVDDRNKLLREAMKEPVTLGSTRQKQAHPLFSVAMTMEKAIQALEAQLGIGPKNRAALGIAVIAEQKGLNELNSEFDDDDGDDEDPRVTVVRGTTER